MSSENVSSLITSLLKTKDPATVGLRRILKQKDAAGKDFPLQTHSLNELGGINVNKKIFDGTERRVIELENENILLCKELQKLKNSSSAALKTSYEQGVNEGIAKGEKNGYEKAHSEFEQHVTSVTEQIKTVLSNVGESNKLLLQESTKSVLDLSLIIAKKIINTELMSNGDIILSVIKKAITFLVDRQKFTVRVASNDLQTVTQKKEFWMSISDKFDNILIEEDQRIEKGGCIIESSTGIVDARISVQIKELEETIDDAWNSATAGAGNENNTYSTSMISLDEVDKSTETESVKEDSSNDHKVL